MFDWDREWHEGAEPPKSKDGWKEVVRQHPMEVSLLLMLSMAILTWWGVS